MVTVKQQSGAVLIISLIIMLVLSLIAISGAKGVVLNERMTFASRDAKVALEVAESMIRLGESHLEGLSDTSSFGSTGWMRSEGNGPDNIFSEQTWTNNSSVEWEVPMKDPDGNAMKGRIYIEMSGLASHESNSASVDLSADTTMSISDDIQVFKLVARGAGIGGTERILMTFYGKSL